MKATITVSFKKSELVSMGKQILDALVDNKEGYTLTIVVPDEKQITIRRDDAEICWQTSKAGH